LGGPEGLWSGNQPAFPAIGGYGNHAYGKRVGLLRLLAVLDQYGITPPLARDKAVADHYPVLIQEGPRRNAECIAHGLSRRRILNEGNRLWREWCDRLYADGATTGRVQVLHLHPWIMGQPWRIRHLDAVLGHITAPAGVWKATGRAIIDWFTAQSGEPDRRAGADARTPRAGEWSRPLALPPGRCAYAPSMDRPLIRWPGNARVAFWVAPNMECFAYLPERRPAQPDIPHYARMDYGNRVGFWRMREVRNPHQVRACGCLHRERLDQCPAIQDAMIAAAWDDMAHGLYHSRPLDADTEEQERASWQDCITHLQERTGKRLQGRLGGGAGYTVRTDDVMAEAGCLYHTSWIIDEQPWPLHVRGVQKCIYAPYTSQINDAGMLAWHREADDFLHMSQDQFDTLYREGADNGRVRYLALHPPNIGRPNAAAYLDEALRYILGHDGVWPTTADDIAEYYLANYYDQVAAWIAARTAQH
jgi:peptidoglycan/xylan/chitin deacetylase (PgdA/CDA1 family)